MGVAMFRRDNQVQRLANSLPGGVSERFCSARAPETDDTGGIRNHDGVIVQILFSGGADRIFRKLFEHDRRTVTSGRAVLRAP